MSIPAGVESVTVTDGGKPLTGPDGAPLDGHFTVAGPDLAVVPEDDYLFGGPARRRWVTAGRFDPLTLVATDATGLSPSGFTYTITFSPKYGREWTRYFQLPKASPFVVLADVLIPDPVAGSYTVLANPATLLAKDANLSDLADPATARGNLGLGSAATRNVGTTSGTVAAGDDPRFGSGGGSAPFRTADIRITTGDVALAPAAAWTVVSSGTTPLSCAIRAAVGDRILVDASFMRTGSGYFLDLAVLTSSGTISRYLGSGTSTPLAEGNPAYYPQSGSYPAATSTVQMVVAPGEVDGNGLVTVALVYRGSGTETVYDSGTYPFYMLLTNPGPQPA